jgi:hypothetical protein
MSRIVILLLIIISISTVARSTPADDPKEMLARAEALYYEADFAKSIELLLRADELLGQQSDQVQQKTDVKLQLALGFLGLNNRARAKQYLVELYALDSDHRIDPQMFSPKVIQLAEEAKAEQNDARCRNLLSEAQRQIGTGNVDAVAKVIDGNQTKCSGLAALNPQVADLFYKEGLEAYRKTQMETAVQKFRAALHAEPKHEFAAQYLDLTESKLEIAADRALLAWRKDFGSGDYALAARDYRELASRSNGDAINDVRTQYRQALSSLVDSWNRACASNDLDAMEAVRGRINSMLPEPTFAEDILVKIKTCTPTGCVQMNSQLALARLRSRVDPQFTSFITSQLKASSVTVRIKARISENGDVTASEPQGGNPLLYPGIRDAIQKWKFSPTLIQGQARCVDTEIPLVINFSSN